MLPTHGQGACMAIEDAAALEVLFRGVRVSRSAPASRSSSQPPSSSASSPGASAPSSSSYDDDNGSDNSNNYDYDHINNDSNNYDCNHIHKSNSNSNHKNHDNDNNIVTQRLTLFDALRLPRVRATQSLSNKMMGPPATMEAEVRKYYSGALPGHGAKTFSKGYNDFFFDYDIRAEAKKVLWGLSDEM